MIVFVRGDRWWGSINVTASEKVFDFSSVDDYIRENEYFVEVRTQRKTNPVDMWM
jgi:hypothetical protein